MMLSDERISKVSALVMPRLVIDENQMSLASVDSVIAGRKAVVKAISGVDDFDKLMIIALEPDGDCGYASQSILRFAEKLCCLSRQWQREGVEVKPILELDVSRLVELAARVDSDRQKDNLLSEDDILCLKTPGSSARAFNRAIMSTRALLCQITHMDIAVGLCWDDPLFPQYFADQLCWSGLMEHNIESQLHRQLASAMSMPVGFVPATLANGPGKAFDACMSAKGEHTFFSWTKGGAASLVTSCGNDQCHIVVPKKDVANFEAIKSTLVDKNVSCRLLLEATLSEFSGCDGSSQLKLIDKINHQGVAGLRVAVINGRDADPSILFDQVPNLYRRREGHLKRTRPE